jgi:lipid II:glycine glycyltransferase (peptidoglycan interpeptide bridge formation enzyme)
MKAETNLDWEFFTSRIPNSHLLQSASWGELKSNFGWEVIQIIGENAGAQILFKELPLGFSWAYIPKGPVGNNWDEIWPLVDKECEKRRAVFLKVEPDLWESDPGKMDSDWLAPKFRPSFHSVQPPRTLVVSLDGSEEQVLLRMKQKTRYNIRLAIKKGVIVREAHDIQRFYDLLHSTGDRNEFGVHSLEYYQLAYHLFAPSESCKLFFAEYEGKLLAAVMVFITHQRAWYFYGASSHEHRNLMAPYAVQWEAIRWSRSKGALVYDLWGVPDQDLETLEADFLHRQDGLWGVYRFKRGFGGDLKRAIGTWDRVYNPIMYRIYRLWVKKIQS